MRAVHGNPLSAQTLQTGEGEDAACAGEFVGGSCCGDVGGDEDWFGGVWNGDGYPGGLVVGVV